MFGRTPLEHLQYDAYFDVVFYVRTVSGNNHPIIEHSCANVVTATARNSMEIFPILVYHLLHSEPVVWPSYRIQKPIC